MQINKSNLDLNLDQNPCVHGGIVHCRVGGRDGVSKEVENLGEDPPLLNY